MSSIRDCFIFPSKGWWVIDNVTHQRIPTKDNAHSYSHLKQLILSHRRGNDLEFDHKEIEDMIHNQTCEREPESYCQQWKGIHVIVNGVKDAARIASSGFQFAPVEVQNQRKAICDACPYWDPKGYMGVGKCTKCKCAKFMYRMAAKKCPISKWLAYK